MTVRASTEKDIPIIVELLKSSLGEALMPKSVAFWRWKHWENPFGKSSVLLAFENETLVGVRAFMKWEWRFHNKVIQSVRAVDTATHPEHQGKGIFTTLTLSLVEQCKTDGIGFVFNTPNKNSMPGYIKMGWHSIGKMGVLVRPIFSLRATSGDNLRGTINEDFIKEFDRRRLSAPDKLETNYNLEYFRWRYINNPNVVYHTFENESCAGIYRVRPMGLGNEFRLCDLNVYASPTNAGKYIMKIAKGENCRIITFAGKRPPFFSINLPIGPIITMRNLSASSDIINKLNPSLGDMEVF